MQRELQVVGCKTKNMFDEECVRRGGRTILAKSGLRGGRPGARFPKNIPGPAGPGPDFKKALPGLSGRAGFGPKQ